MTRRGHVRPFAGSLPTPGIHLFVRSTSRFAQTAKMQDHTSQETEGGGKPPKEPTRPLLTSSAVIINDSKKLKGY